MKIYHVFTHNIDEYVEKYRQALARYKYLVKEYGCARLYIKVFDNDNDAPISEDCLLSHGEYPR